MLIHFDSKMLVAECQDIITTSWHSNQTLQFPKWSDQDQSEENTTNCPFPLPICTTWHRSPRTSLKNGYYFTNAFRNQTNETKDRANGRNSQCFQLAWCVNSTGRWTATLPLCAPLAQQRVVLSGIRNVTWSLISHLCSLQICCESYSTGDFCFWYEYVGHYQVPACSHVLPVLLK